MKNQLENEEIKVSNFKITSKELDVLQKTNRCRIRRSQSVSPELGSGSLLHLSGEYDEVLVKILSVRKHIRTGLVDFWVELVRFCTDEVRGYFLTEEVLED